MRSSFLLSLFFCWGLFALDPPGTKRIENVNSLIQPGEDGIGEKYLFHWTNHVPPHGYRLGTFNDFISDEFSDYYNRHNGIMFSFLHGPGGVGICSIGLVEGYLNYPAHQYHSSPTTLWYMDDDTTEVGCYIPEVGRALIGTLNLTGNDCYGDYTDQVFSTPVADDFFRNNFATVKSECNWGSGQSRYSLLVRLDAIVPPSPTPAPRPYHCCEYVNPDEKHGMVFCQYPGAFCPEVPGYTKFSNISADDCSFCYCNSYACSS